MATYDLPPATPGRRLICLLLTVLSAPAAWNDARVSRKALNRLSPHELDDIGLCRADIDQLSAARRR